MIVCTLITKYNQHDGLLDKILGLSAERSGVRIPGRGKCSLRTTVVHTNVNYPLYLYISLYSRLKGAIDNSVGLQDAYFRLKISIDTSVVIRCILQAQGFNWYFCRTCNYSCYNMVRCILQVAGFNWYPWWFEMHSIAYSRLKRSIKISMLIQEAYSRLKGSLRIDWWALIRRKYRRYGIWRGYREYLSYDEWETARN